MEGRRWNLGLGVYRYGFNGKENDNEVKGEGNQYDYGFRVYNPQIGRFLSTDPLAKKYAFYTPYQFAGNKPIVAVDIDGQEDHIYTISFFKKQGQAVFTSSHNEGNVIGIDRNGYEVYDRPEKFVAAYNIAFIDGTSYSLRQSFDSYKEMQGVEQSGFYSQAVSLSLYKGFDLGLTSFYGSEFGYGLYSASSRIVGNQVGRLVADNTRIASKLNWAAQNEVLLPVTASEKLEILRAANKVGGQKTLAIVEGNVGGKDIFEYAASGDHLFPGALAFPKARAFTVEAPPIIRPNDAEPKLLEYLNDLFNKNKQVQGNINIMTEKPVCDACKAKIEDFKGVYPNVNVKISEPSK